jgi:hypothetical protein
MWVQVEHKSLFQSQIDQVESTLISNIPIKNQVKISFPVGPIPTGNIDQNHIY